MTEITQAQLDEWQALADAATPGPWFHCQPFQIVKSERTIHGKVPSCHVDYVSTWPDLGTPQGHRVVIPREGAETRVVSADMAFIAAARTAVPALIAEVRGLQKERDYAIRETASCADELALPAKKAEAENARLREALEQAYTVLSFAFNRIHVLPRSRDTALASDIGKVRAQIAAALKGEKSK